MLVPLLAGASGCFFEVLGFEEVLVFPADDLRGHSLEFGLLLALAFLGLDELHAGL